MSAYKSIFTAARLLVVALLLSATAAQAQPGGGRHAERLGQLENAKIAFITGRIALSQEQAQRFWPVYNEFTARRRDINQNGRQLRKASMTAQTDQQVRDNINQSFALRQQELNLEKDYFERFQKVLTVRQVGQLFQAERDFTKEVIKRVADRRGARPGLGASLED